jgi:hypothetical protein
MSQATTETSTDISDNSVVPSDSTCICTNDIVSTDNSGVIYWGMIRLPSDSSSNTHSDFALIHYMADGTVIGTPTVITPQPCTICAKKADTLINGKIDTSLVNKLDNIITVNIIAANKLACSSLTVNGSNVLMSKSAFQYSLNYGPLINNISAGISTTIIAESITIPISGIYTLSTSLDVHIDASNGCAVGVSDSIVLSIESISDSSFISNSLKPYTMPNTESSGINYNINATNMSMLTAGSYNVKLIFNNVSGNMAFPGGIYANYYLIGLCN